MAKTILIPIDFTVESLNTLKLCLEKHRHEEVEIILMFAEYLNDSITDLSFFNAAKIIQAHMTPIFNDALTILKNSFESTKLYLRIELFHGYNTHAFLHFAEFNRIDVCYIPASYHLKIKKRAFEPLWLITASGLPVVEISWTPSNNISDEDQLHQLFI